MPRKRSIRLKKKRTKRVLIKRTKRVRKSKSKSNVRRKTRKKRKKGGSSLCKGLTCDGVPRNPLSVEIININFLKSIFIVLWNNTLFVK